MRQREEDRSVAEWIDNRKQRTHHEQSIPCQLIERVIHGGTIIIHRRGGRQGSGAGHGLALQNADTAEAEVVGSGVEFSLAASSGNIAGTVLVDAEK